MIYWIIIYNLEAEFNKKSSGLGFYKKIPICNLKFLKFIFYKKKYAANIALVIFYFIYFI